MNGRCRGKGALLIFRFFMILFLDLFLTNMLIMMHKRWLAFFGLMGNKQYGVPWHAGEVIK